MNSTFAFVLCFVGLEATRNYSVGYGKFCDSLLVAGRKEYDLRCRDHQPNPNFRAQARKKSDTNSVVQRTKSSPENTLRRKGMINIPNDEMKHLLSTPIVKVHSSVPPVQKEIQVVIPVEASDASLHLNPGENKQSEILSGGSQDFQKATDKPTANAFATSSPVQLKQNLESHALLRSVQAPHHETPQSKTGKNSNSSLSSTPMEQRSKQVTSGAAQASHYDASSSSIPAQMNQVRSSKKLPRSAQALQVENQKPYSMTDAGSSRSQASIKQTLAGEVAPKSALAVQNRTLNSPQFQDASTPSNLNPAQRKILSLASQVASIPFDGSYNRPGTESDLPFLTSNRDFSDSSAHQSMHPSKEGRITLSLSISKQ
jgi:hypothetical protein